MKIQDILSEENPDFSHQLNRKYKMCALMFFVVSIKYIKYCS